MKKNDPIVYVDDDDRMREAIALLLKTVGHAPMASHGRATTCAALHAPQRSAARTALTNCDSARPRTEVCFNS